MNKKFEIFGVLIDAVPQKEADRRIRALLSVNVAQTVVTPNSEMLLEARYNPALRDILNSAALALPDSVGVSLALRCMGAPEVSRIAGIDIAELLFHEAAKRGMKVAIVGGADGRAKEAAKQLSARFLGLSVLGEGDIVVHNDGSSPTEWDVLQRLSDFSPDILCACLGVPKQELWMKRIIPKFPSVRVALGLGGAVDVWAGAVPRAPRFMRRMGFEWLWRLVLEPWRIGRIINVTIVFPLLLFFGNKKGPKNGPIYR